MVQIFIDIINTHTIVKFTSRFFTPSKIVSIPSLPNGEPRFENITIFLSVTFLPLWKKTMIYIDTLYINESKKTIKFLTELLR